MTTHRMAVIGAGGFAAFAVDNFLQTGAVHLRAVNDIDDRRALALARVHGASVRSVDGIMGASVAGRPIGLG
jgi:predicted dehydrogenase